MKGAEQISDHVQSGQNSDVVRFQPSVLHHQPCYDTEIRADQSDADGNCAGTGEDLSDMPSVECLSLV